MGDMDFKLAGTRSGITALQVLYLIETILHTHEEIVRCCLFIPNEREYNTAKRVLLGSVRTERL